MDDFFYDQFLFASMQNDTFGVDISATADKLSFSYIAYWSISDGGYHVDYGDGTDYEKPAGSTGTGSSVTHTYDSPGSYKVRFKGLGSGLSRLLLQSQSNLVGCNFNWMALGEAFSNGQQMFNSCPNLAGTMTSLPAGLTNGRLMFYGCNNLVIRITSLPAGLTGNTESMFRGCYKAEIDLDTLVANAPTGGWPGVTSMMAFLSNAGTGNTPGTVTGSRSAFQAMFPNATDWTNSFLNTNTTA